MTRRLAAALLALAVLPAASAEAQTYEALQARLRALPRGSPITVVVLRAGREVTLTAVKN